jgi:hypothetical protein
VPKGTKGIQAASQDIAARASAGGGDKRLWFKLKPGESATVRFLEQGDDIAWAWMHELPPRGNQRWGDEIPCLDQERQGLPCPGCQAGADRSFSGFINLIWRNGPVYKKNAEGYFERDAQRNYIQAGNADVIAVWNSGIRVFEELSGKDATYLGLMSRDFTVTRHGEGTQTKYQLEPFVVDGETKATPMSDADKKLAAEKYDFTAETEPGSFEDYQARASGSGSSDSVQPEQVRQQSPFGGGDKEGVSAFMKPSGS